jgi:hypothetical protein
MTIVQVKLTVAVDATHRREKITWVDNKPGLKVGAQVELKGDKTVWNVAEIYPTEHAYNEFDWHRNWTNNI